MPAAIDYRIQFSELDEHISQASLDDGCSFPSLREYILQRCPPGPYRTLFIFRGIFTWLLQNYNNEIHNPVVDSPLDLISEYQAGFLTINSLVDAICRELEIQTTTVNGLARVINGNIYRKNVDIRTKVQASWNAVNIDGNWLLLNTDVLFPAKTDTDDEGFECREITSPRYNTTQLRPCICDILQQTQSSYDEFWFLTSPKHFIKFCYPDDPAQQFLPSDAQVSYQDFLNRPLLHPAYFRYRFEILSENTCKLIASEGQCYVSLYTEKAIASGLELSCELIRLLDRDSYSLTDEVTSIMVTKFRTLDTFTFEFRFVEEGTYRAVVSCEEVDTTTTERCCELEIQCNETNDVELEPRFMSTNTSNTFGIGPTAISAGFLSSSENYPKSYIESDDDGGDIRHFIKFKLSEEVVDTYEYQPNLEACDMRGILQLYRDCVSSKVDKTKAELAVTISIPKDRANVAEEMVLTISACNKEEGNQEFVPVYYHLISLKRGASGEIKQMEKKRKMIKRDRYFQTMFEEEQHLEQEILALKRDIDKLKEDFPGVSEDLDLDDNFSITEGRKGSLEKHEDDNDYEDANEQYEDNRLEGGDDFSVAGKSQDVTEQEDNQRKDMGPYGRDTAEYARKQSSEESASIKSLESLGSRTIKRQSLKHTRKSKACAMM